jgi:hypothetical protein
LDLQLPKQSVLITIKVVSANPAIGEVNSIHHHDLFIIFVALHSGVNDKFFFALKLDLLEIISHTGF